jgi:DNA ligase-1
MEEMKKVIEIVENIRETSGTNDKIAILQKNKDNEILKKVLLYTYDPFRKYGMSEKTLETDVPYNEPNFSIFELLDILASSNINDSLRGKTNSFLTSIRDRNEQGLYKCILLKDLKLGCNITTINKVWKDLIPKFEVMLAESYFKQKEGFLKGKNFIISTKLDGNRLVIIKRNGNIKMFTRQGKIMEGLIEIETDANLLPDNMVYDGELIADNINNLPSDELFRVTMTKARKDGVKQGLIFNCFDMLPLDEFEKGKSKAKCSERKHNLEDVLNKLNLKYISNVKTLYEGSDESKILELLNWAKSNNLEGVMCQLSDGQYECKRTKNILKVKAMQDMDLKVVGIERGEGKYCNTLGRINVEYKDNIIGVGSGFSDSMRNEIFNNQDKYIGRIAKIQYFEESTNQKDNKISLRFPVFLNWRFDKTEPSYN